MKDRWGTGRVEAFSDGVFAIAITLLVLDIRVPEAALADPWHGIWHQWPSYFAYVTSFLTIGGLWLAHHGIFRRLDYVNSLVLRINLILLMAVSFLPFPTRLVAEAVRDDDAERAAVVFYGVSLYVIAILIWALWTAILRDRSILSPDVTEEDIASMKSRTTPALGFYAGVIAIAIIAPRVAAVGYLVIAVVAVLRARGDRQAPEPAALS